MRHLKKKKLGKGKDHRRKLLRSLASSALLYEKIVTSHANARALRSYLEPLITRSKTDNLHNRRVLLAGLSKNATKKVFEVIGPRVATRPGGYIRLTKLNKPSAGKSKVLVEIL